MNLREILRGTGAVNPAESPGESAGETRRNLPGNPNDRMTGYPLYRDVDGGIVRFEVTAYALGLFEGLLNPAEVKALVSARFDRFNGRSALTAWGLNPWWVKEWFDELRIAMTEQRSHALGLLLADRKASRYERLVFGLPVGSISREALRRGLSRTYEVYRELEDDRIAAVTSNNAKFTAPASPKRPVYPLDGFPAISQTAPAMFHVKHSCAERANVQVRAFFRG